MKEHQNPILYDFILLIIRANLNPSFSLINDLFLTGTQTPYLPMVVFDNNSPCADSATGLAVDKRSDVLSGNILLTP